MSKIKIEGNVVLTVPCALIIARSPHYYATENLLECIELLQKTYPEALDTIKKELPKRVALLKEAARVLELRIEIVNL